MLQMIIGDYIINFKPALKRWWKKTPSNWYMSIYIPVYFLIILPFMVLDTKWTWEYVKFVLDICLLILGTNFAEIYPNRLEKSFFLCPMAQKIRRKYLVTAYWFRVLFFTTLFTACEILTGVIFAVPLFFIMVYSASYFLIMLVMNLTLGNDIVKAEHKKGALFGHDLLKGICMLLGIVILYILNLNDLHLKKDSVYTEQSMWIYAVVLMIQGIFTAIFLLKFYQDIMQVAEDYEKIY